jgi:hypothetical protein
LKLTMEQIASRLYHVKGSPSGTEALIAGADSRGWKVLRTTGGRCDEDWTGNYRSPYDAIRAIYEFFEQEIVYGGPHLRA